MEVTFVDLIIFVIGFSIALYFYGTRKYGHFKNTGVKYSKPSYPFFGSTFEIFTGREHFKDFLLKHYENCGDDK